MSLGSEVIPQEFIMSEGFYLSPGSYKPFDVDAYGRVQEACVDSRNTDQEVLTVDMQTPGGLTGRATDRAITHAATTGEPQELAVALVDEAEAATDRVAGAHRSVCKYVAGLTVVLGKIAEPGDEAEDDLDRWAQHYFDKPRAADVAFSRASNAAGQMKQFVDNTGVPTELVDMVDERFPDVNNVPIMTSPNTAAFYIVNHSPDLGLDRQTALRNVGLPHTAYHDSVGATITRLGHVPEATRDLRIAARLLRTYATRWAVAGPESNVRYLEVVSSDGGVRVVEHA